MGGFADLRFTSTQDGLESDTLRCSRFFTLPTLLRREPFTGGRQIRLTLTNADGSSHSDMVVQGATL